MIPLQEFVDRLRRGVTELRDEIKDGILRGEPQSFDAYQHAIGRIAGLDAAAETLNDLVKRVNAGD